MFLFVLLGPQRNTKYREVRGPFDFTHLVRVGHAYQRRAEVQLLVSAKRNACERNWRRAVIGNYPVRRIKDLDVLACIRGSGTLPPGALIAVPASCNAHPVVGAFGRGTRRAAHRRRRRRGFSGFFFFGFAGNRIADRVADWWIFAELSR